MKHKVTWILLADGARARLLVNRGFGTGLESALGKEFIADNRRSGDLSSDRPGRAFDSGGQGRHAIEDSTDPHRHEQQKFAQSLADLLEEQCNKKSYDQLIVIAAPKILGDLRSKFSKAVSNSISDELNKDLTKTALHELPKHLADFIRL